MRNFCHEGHIVLAAEILSESALCFENFLMKISLIVWDNIFYTVNLLEYEKDAYRQLHIGGPQRYRGGHELRLGKLSA